VIIAVINFDGVTSNEGLNTAALSGTVFFVPDQNATSSLPRSSMGMRDPSGMDKSNVDDGAAT